MKKRTAIAASGALYYLQQSGQEAYCGTEHQSQITYSLEDTA